MINELKITIFLIACFILTGTGCYSSDAVFNDGMLEMKEISMLEPIKFLTKLKECRFKFYSVSGTSFNWIKNEDVPILLDKLHDNSKCAAVVRIESSKLYTSYSTVSQEASFLLLGYIKKKYPPSLDSFQNLKKRKEMIMEYFKKNKKR